MSFSPNPRAWAQIDLQALHGNLQRARELHPDKSIVAVIKANAYGHGMTEIAASLKQNPDGAEVLAVATMDEVIALQLQGTGKRLLLLGGFRNADELRFLLEAGIEFVIHADYQLALLKSRIRDNPRSRFSVWLKADTGMHRLGMTAEEIAAALEFLVACSQTSRVIVMSHLACVDSDDPDAAAVTALQVSRFQDIVAAARQLQDKRIEFSLSASAGILARTDLGFDYIRPGIMLYGGSPFADHKADELGLSPVMTLKARLIAIKDVAEGESIGYGATYTCQRNTRVGVVSIGYADGYPRSAPNGTPVLVQSERGLQRSQLIGRVSMDMITIDLTAMENAQVGDAVILWGQGLLADEVARHAGTISYDLFCRITRRVSYNYQ